MRKLKPLTVVALFEASEAAMEVGRRIKARADRMRQKNADVRSGKPTTDKGHAQAITTNDAQSPPGERKTSPVKGRLTKDQLGALRNRAKRQLKAPSKRSQDDYRSAQAFNAYFAGEHGDR